MVTIGSISLGLGFCFPYRTNQLHRREYNVLCTCFNLTQMRYIIYKVLSIQICTQSSLEMCYVPCIRTSLICTGVDVDLLLDHGFLLGEFGLKEQFIKQDLLSCCTVFLPQPLPARPCPSDLQVVCHPQGLQHVRVVPVEPVPAQLRLGQPGPGAAHPAPRRAQRGPG